MGNQQLRSLEPAGEENDPRGTPLEEVLNSSFGSSAERRVERLNEVARRQQRQRSGPQFTRFSAASQTLQRQLSRQNLKDEIRTNHRTQYAMARRTFDRLHQEILRNPRYLTNAGFMAEYSYWKVYFHSATAMDNHTFHRFTVWHSRFQQQARSTPRATPVAPRRPEWRTLNEMLRVCEATGSEAVEPQAEAPEPDAEAQASPLSIGAGLLRDRVGERRRRPEGWNTRLSAHLRQLLQGAQPAEFESPVADENPLRLV